MLPMTHAHGGPPLRGLLRVSPEDFQVREVLGYAADGDGEHVLLEVCKREANSAWVAEELARFAGVRALAVSYAGRKDRHALTWQSFSVQLAGRPEPDWSAFPHSQVRIVSSQRHRRKLKRGALAGNEFRIVVRDVEGLVDAAERVLQAMQSRGVPNYFGAQRFGRGGNNVAQALAMFAGQRVTRNQRSILLSAARARIFNEVLDARVQRGCWDRPLEGELWCLHGSHSWFGPEPFSEALQARLAAGDIHPSGPLWGRGVTATCGQVQALEQDVVARRGELAAGLEEAGLRQDRRALRLLPRALQWDWTDARTLVLSFALPAGCYATTVLREVVQGPAAGQSSGTIG